jgi:hypothetical protein
MKTNLCISCKLFYSDCLPKKRIGNLYEVLCHVLYRLLTFGDNRCIEYSQNTLRKGRFTVAFCRDNIWFVGGNFVTRNAT